MALPIKANGGFSIGVGKSVNCPKVLQEADILVDAGESLCRPNRRQGWIFPPINFAF